MMLYTEDRKPHEMMLCKIVSCPYENWGLTVVLVCAVDPGEGTRRPQFTLSGVRERLRGLWVFSCRSKISH